MLEGSNTAITGDFTAEVFDIAGIAPTRIIRTTDPFLVRSRITITTGASLLVPPEEWIIRLFLESVGPGNEVQLGVPARLLPVGFNQTSYTADIIVPAGSVQGTAPADPALAATSSGLYTLAAVLTLRHPGLPGTMLPVAGFSQVGFLQFFP